MTATATIVAPALSVLGPCGCEACEKWADCEFCEDCTPGWLKEVTEAMILADREAERIESLSLGDIMYGEPTEDDLWSQW